MHTTLSGARPMSWLARLAPRRARATSPGETSPGVAEDDVRWAYRLLLDREAESDAVVREKLVLASRRELRNAILLSPEFRSRNPEIAGFDETCIVLAELAGGCRIYVDLSDVYVGQAIARGAYERDEADLVRRLVAPGQNAIDCGANLGFYTLLLASLLGPDGRVHAFEPLPANAALLDRSIAENRLGDRIALERVALGRSADVLHLVHVPGGVNSGGAFLAPRDQPVPPGHAAVPVAVRKLDDVALRRPISFVKLDVEGAEPLVLEGARELLAADRPVVLSEIHRAQLARVAGTTPAELIADLADRGWECRRVAPGGRLGEAVRDVGEPIASVAFVHRDRAAEVLARAQ